MITQFDTESADLDISSQIAVLTDTPDASNAVQAQAVIVLGDGAKNLDGTGGDFEITVTVGGVTVEPDPQVITVSSGATRAIIMSEPFAVPANSEVVIKVLSPNAADTDVDVTAYLYDSQPVNPTSRYQAKVWWIDDDGAGTPTDRYVCIWLKDGEPVTSGITSPTIQIIQVSDGNDLVGETGMTEIASLGMYRYDETSTRLADGAGYIAKVMATIDGGSRTWEQPLGRPSV